MVCLEGEGLGRLDGAKKPFNSICMLRRLTPKRFIPLRRTSFLRAHFSSVADDHQDPVWISSNKLFRKYPRLQFLEKCQSLCQLKPVLSYIIVSGLLQNPFIASRILYFFSVSAPNLSHAALVFSQIEEPSLFSWNTVIRGFANSEQQYPSVAFSFYAHMLATRTLPDKYTFPFLLKACRSVFDLNLGKLVHAHALILGFDADQFVHTALVSMYLLCGSLGDARQLFDVFPHRDVVSWTSMISCLADQGHFELALGVFNEMRTGGHSYVRPNVATMVSALSACASLGSLHHTKALHAYLEKIGLAVEVFIGNSLIDAYGKCGSIVCASQFFRKMDGRDLHSWTTMIMGLAIHGFGEEALSVFFQMKKIGVIPDSVTFVAVLSACSHAGLVNQGMRIFETMESEYKIGPELKHCGCMVDLFGRAGLLDRAYEFVSALPGEPNLHILGSLLSSCRVHGNLELGEFISKEIESVCEYKGGAHVLLSNMYANKSQWHEVVLLREEMTRDVRKPPGQSWIEIRGVLHEFVVEDKSDPCSREINNVLDGLGSLM